MDRKQHFHIQWNVRGLDWEIFEVRHEALARALEIAIPGEIFTIKECSEESAVCGPKPSSIRQAIS